MNSDLLGYAVAAFVALAAISQLLQAIAIRRIEKSVADLESKASQLLPQAKAVLTKAEATLEESRRSLAEITAGANDILTSARGQILKIDELVTDATTRARIQMDRAEVMVNQTVDKVQQSVIAVQSGVMRPVREIAGVAAGVRTAVGYLLKGQRPDVSRATLEDEMFI